MIDKILSALEKSGVKIYQITETVKESAELFFVKRNLDMQRMAEVTQAEVVVYKEFTEGEKHCLGSSMVIVQESLTQEEMEKMFADALYAAGFVKNQFYELYDGKEKAQEKPDPFANHALAEIAGRFAGALFAQDVREDVFLNSAEIFAYRMFTHIRNSKGVDVSFQNGWVWGEFVAQCKSGQDVETYRNFMYRDFALDALKEKVKDVLDMTRARAEAVAPPPAGEYRVILPAMFYKEILKYYLARSNTSMIYQKYSAFAPGCDVQGDAVEKDKINLMLKVTVPYSGEGIAMRERELVKDGKLELIHGGNRFAYYLQTEPTGNYDAFAMPAGNVTMEEMRSMPYLEVVNFSDFQMDSFTGHFGGEIRLAFLYDGSGLPSQRIPVTGGSINGNLFEAQKKLVFSKEMQIEDDFEGPAALCLEGICVAGA